MCGNNALIKENINTYTADFNLLFLLSDVRLVFRVLIG